MDLNKPHPHSLSPRALAVAGWSAFILAGVLFLAIAWNVSSRTWLAGIDAQVADWLHARASGGAVMLFLAVTHLNSALAIAAWSVIFAAVLARLREWHWMLTLGVTVGGMLLLNVILKLAYERLRPRFDTPLLELATYSFPSGHTSAAVAFYGVLAAFLVSRFYERRRRAACVAGAVAAVALVAFSRIYLGAHYLSDVLAAACAATVWLVVCLAGGHALVRQRLKIKWLFIAAAAFVTAAGAVVLPLEDWSLRLEHAIEAMDLLAGLTVFTAVSVVAILLLVPAWIFPLIAGAVFGFGWGFLAASAATLASALAAFALARTVLRSRLERLARRSASFKAVDAAVRNDGWKLVALMRISPLMPSGLKSYFLGLTRVRRRDYLIGSAAGMLPAVALKAYVGAAGMGAVSEGGPLQWTLFIAGVAATLAIAWVVRRKARVRLRL
jgi:uncharacterized membrane protein YdjX (TVP38/TMEM64 family)/membrane-associated phospholipid phosphatase